MIIGLLNPQELYFAYVSYSFNRFYRSLTQLYRHGRLSDTGYLSISPVDQGVEHTAGSSFSSNPIYFDSEKIIRLAIEAGCNAVASTMGGLAMLSRKYAH